MKIIKTASGKKQIKISKSEWESIGKKAGWTKEAQSGSIRYRQPESDGAHLYAYPKIKEFFDSAKTELVTIDSVADDIFELEEQIINDAKNRPEGDDYYGKDYLSQMVGGDVRALIEGLEEGNIYDALVLLRRYQEKLTQTLKDM